MFNFNRRFPQMPQIGQGLRAPQMQPPQMQPLGQQPPQMQPMGQPNTQFPLNPQGGPMHPPQMQGMAPGGMMSDWHNQMQDWRSQRPDHPHGQMMMGDFRNQMTDWRQQRPDRQSYMSGMLPNFGG